MDHSTRVEAGVGFGIEMALKIVPLICKGIDSAQAKARHRKFNALWEKAQTPGMFTEEGEQESYKPYELSHSLCLALLTSVGTQI